MFANVLPQLPTDAFSKVCYFTLFLVIFVIYKLTYWTRKGVPNDVCSLWNRYTNPFHESDTNGYRKFGKVVGMYEVLQPVLLVGDPELTKEILVKRFLTFPNHRFFGGINQIGGKSIFVLKYEQWKRVRAIVSPTFTASKLKGMEGQIHEAIDTLINNFGDAAKQNISIDVKTFLLSFTLDTFSSCAFGLKVDSLKDPFNPLVKNSKKLFNTNVHWLSLIAFMCPSLAPLGSLFKFSIFNPKALKYFEDLIISLIQRREELNINSVDFVSLLKEAEIVDLETNTRRGLTLGEIVDQALIFLIAGHDTTATTLSMLFYNLAVNPSIQDKLIKEVSELDDNQVTDWEAVKTLPYLDAVVHEILRYCPPVPRVERRTAEACTLAGMKLRKNQLITIPVHAMHHDADNFPNPEKFDPDRFLPENVGKNNMLAYLPFAQGPRSCIGTRFAIMEIKFCIVKVFRKYRFSRAPEAKELEFYRGQLVTTAKEIILKPTTLDG